MSDVFLAEPPAGEVRSLTDPPTRQAEIIAVAAATTAIAAIAVGVRFYTRVRIVGGRISLDDSFVLVSLLFTILSIVVNYQQIQHGLTYHKWDILYDNYNIGYPAYAIAGTCTYALGVGFAKLSILLFYLRLSPQQWFCNFVYGLIGTVSCYSLIYVFLNIFPCRPVAAAWDLTIEQSKCIDPWNAYYALSILNILMDVATLVLPVPVVAALRMPIRQKISLILLFATGILRTALIPSLITTRDRPWDVTEDYVFSYLEANAGIICASVPALKPFFLRFMPAFIASHMTERGRNASKSKASYAQQRSFGLASVAEQNRQRRMMQHGAYELSSIDDNGRPFDKHTEDDEAKLWSPCRKECGTKVNTQTKGSHNSSLDTLVLEDMTVPRGINETTVSAEPSRSVQGAGIQVHHETVVHHDEA
ncbi:putative integral membrane protein [Eutypa lata UCREL1]|uniref:Putative integral membrane protein n=1 Tax=Eutypa lata (strain UCR-EL1) TaxID=1287681 RepID=M7SQ22_EUTLA|nr:putative integral membrane protein [Eutypa lata UCREL1]